MEIATQLSTIENIIFAVLWLGIIAFLGLKKKKGFVYLLFFTIFYVYLYNVLNYTIFQYQSLILAKYFDPHLMLNGIEAGKNLNLIPLATLTSEDIKTSLLNILLMMPFGFGLPFITNYRMKKVVVVGLLFSVAMELVQLLTGLMGGITFRVADINDVIFNMIGAVIGYILFVSFVSLYRQIFPNWKQSNPIMRYIGDRPQIDTPKGKYVLIAAILLIAIAGMLFAMYQKPAPVRDYGIGANGMGNEQEGATPQSGDLCGGTGGTGEIVSIENNSFTIKRNSGVTLLVKLTNQATIKTSAGPASLSDLKIGNRVVLVGGPNADGSFTADTVGVCGMSDFVSVGDKLGAMTVVSVKPFNTGQYSPDPKMMQLGPQNIQAALKGPIEVTGVYSAVHSGIGFDGYCMSISDAASLARLPALPGGASRPYFCFRNGEMAQQKLGEESRTITVTIDNYQLNSYPSEVMDWADLISVGKE